MKMLQSIDFHFPSLQWRIVASRKSISPLTIPTWPSEITFCFQKFDLRQIEINTDNKIKQVVYGQFAVKILAYFSGIISEAL